MSRNFFGNKKVIKDDHYKEMMNSGISWLINNQATEGYWVRLKDHTNKIFEPNYCGYAILGLWKWIQITSELHNNTLLLVTNKIINATVPLTDYEKISSEHKTIVKKYENIVSENASLRRKNTRLRLFILIFSIVFVALLVALISITGFMTPLWSLITQHAMAIGVIAGVIAIATAMFWVARIIIRALRN